MVDFNLFDKLRTVTQHIQYNVGAVFAWGATRMARGGIRLVHGHTKSTLITYFSGMKIDPKYTFLHAFFLIFLTKNTPFFPILHVFAPLNDVRAYSAWSWKTTLITWIFGRAWYPPWHSSGPPGSICHTSTKSSAPSMMLYEKVLTGVFVGAVFQWLTCRFIGHCLQTWTTRIILLYNLNSQEHRNSPDWCFELN